MEYNKLRQFFTVKTILIFMLLWVATNIWMRYGATGSVTLRNLTGEEQIPDTMFFGYSLERLFAMFQKFGVEGRTIYLKFQYKDYIYPLIYSTLLVGFLVRTKLPKPFRFFIFIPWVAAFLDYGENIIIRNQVLNFPDLNANLVAIASALTLSKWSLVFVSVGLIIVFWGISFLDKKRD